MENEPPSQVLDTHQEIRGALIGMYPEKCRRLGLCTMWAANVEQDALAVAFEKQDLEAAIPVHESRAKSAERQCAKGQTMDLRKDFNPGVCNYGIGRSS